MVTAPASPPSTPHPYLEPSRASSITSWANSLPTRNLLPPNKSEVEEMSREAAFEAYRQLKLALFSKIRDTQSSGPGRPTPWSDTTVFSTRRTPEHRAESRTLDKDG